MNKKQLGLLLLAFLVSRILALMAGIHLRYDALLSYWQYLDLETLRHHLLRGLWYDHAQPPFFNLLLGLVLKTAGSAARPVFALLLYAISLANTLLLYTILTRLVRHPRLPLCIALLYMLSPALLIFETELFYTTLISLLLLLSVYFLLRLRTDGLVTDHRRKHRRWITVAGICVPLAIACLTRSMYHLLWLIVLAVVLIFLFRKDPARKALTRGFSLAILLVAGWYAHNYAIFGQFSSSSWLGMNLARTVFHDHPVMDSSRIEAYEPFSPIQTYTLFIDREPLKKYTGLNDRDLFGEYKNDTLLNATHIGYIQVSQQYMKAATAYIRRHPVWYLQNVAQSGLLFFAPATRYPFAEATAKKMKYYDLLYSFNLSELVTGKTARRIAVTLSALPKLLIYALVIFLLFRAATDRWTNFRNLMDPTVLSPVTVFILLIIAYSFVIGSFIEHYENMRFRYEIEPLFLILLARALDRIKKPEKP